MTEKREPFLMILDLYKAAVFTKDVDAFVNLYHNDIHIFDMWGTWSTRGLDSWRGMATEWFSSLEEERVMVGISDAQSMVYEELAFGHAVLTYTAISPEGKELRALSNRLTMILKYDGSSWKILHEHTSSPVDHSSLKAILQYPGNG
ncbi:YybH family protein [Saccharophagus degradans]|uniref:SnoaL-like domain-containing protein n=1 Tax=Saccharophagus degradans (strain 2-40 / ATCC 43961 / DSM 17024) TaxID=203122 RepID=Q21G46_SACD2|nr:nuclear transport factor 2 family protein [Saccharophagus degradans]ABD82333.1 hypothetical protein Sde_3076 [Saccharophagus degradans 2-40]